MAREIVNPYVKRLYSSLTRYVDEDTAEKISYNMPLSKTPTVTRKFKWAEDICCSLEERFDDESIKDIRVNCACGPSKSNMVMVKKIYDSSVSFEDFAQKYNKENLGSTIVIEDDKILFSYPECYCSVVKRVEKLLSKTWCYCTLGYAKKMFEYVLGSEVNVNLLKSIKTGGEKCLMVIERV